MEDLEPRDADEGDELEAAIMQADHAFGAESVGTTAEEELAGESLNQRLEERPDRPSADVALSVVDDEPNDEHHLGVESIHRYYEGLMRALPRPAHRRQGPLTPEVFRQLS